MRVRDCPENVLEAFSAMKLTEFKPGALYVTVGTLLVLDRRDHLAADSLVVYLDRRIDADLRVMLIRVLTSDGSVCAVPFPRCTEELSCFMKASSLP